MALLQRCQPHGRGKYQVGPNGHGRRDRSLEGEFAATRVDLTVGH